MPNLLTVVAGAIVLLWPALLNGYPIVFSDTAGFLQQALEPEMGWDKPWIYGPFLTPFHGRLTLWPAIFAQALILSALVWLARLSLSRAGRLAHLATCLLLAIGTAAPWFAATLMPDIFAPVTVLGFYLLANARLTRPALAFVATVTTLAIAVHLAHLVLAAACLVTLSLLRWRVLWRQFAPLAAALALLVGTNVVGNGLVAVSPYGSVFALARLATDGPARDVLQRSCPDAGWRLCAWKDRLPADSDDFLWDPNGPVWAEAYGPVRLAPEAAAIVRLTILTEPLQVLRTALANTALQLTLVNLGDTLTPDHLANSVRPSLEHYFPPAETARFDAGLQARGRLPAFAAPLNPWHTTLLLAGALATLAIAVRCWNNDRPLAVLAVLTLVALLVNAAATGALSHPHDRYQARIAWLLLLTPAMALSPRRVALPGPACRSATSG